MKKRVLISAVVVADLDRATYRPRDMEDYAKQLERAVKEFHDFVRDHRSMDWVSMTVEREYEDQCSFCGRIWEYDTWCCNEAVAERKAITEANI